MFDVMIVCVNKPSGDESAITADRAGTQGTQKGTRTCPWAKQHNHPSLTQLFSALARPLTLARAQHRDCVKQIVATLIVCPEV